MQKSAVPRHRSLLHPLLAGALVVGLAACGGGDDDVAETPLDTATAADSVETDVSVEQPTDETAGTESTADATTSDETDATDTTSDLDESGADLDLPPDPDPDATADDHPDFEWAFEEGYLTARGYGRADFYDPGTVSEPGSAVGLAATEAYYDGFALGLAEYEAELAAAEARIATVLDETIVGQVIRQGVGEDWVADTAGVTEDCGAMVEATNPGVPCIARWINADREDVIAVRLGDSGKEIDIAMLVEVGQDGREVLDWWARADGEPMPDWVMPWDGMPDYLQ